MSYDFLENKIKLARQLNLYSLIVEGLREFSEEFENMHSVSVKSRRRFLHLSSFSD